jgi:hypothetical protein
MSEEMKIGFIGSAGTGKSTIARLLGEELDIEFRAAKHITQEILDREGYEYGSGVRIERFLASSERQLEILRGTLTMHQQDGSFVTDRTVLDLAAYGLCEMHDTDPKALRSLMHKCQKHISLYTHLFLCPWRFIQMRPNQKRTLNPWYQMLIHTIELGLIQEWDIKVVVLESESPEERVPEVLKSMGVEAKDDT